MTKTFGVTGGAGFIGTNFCDRVLASGNSVVILDDLSRPGAGRNLTWLNERHPTGIDFMEVDISSTNPNLRSFTEKSDVIFHLAGQVAVTTSVQAPMRDFEVNALGTLNLLEAVRGSSHRPGFVFVSTNKVYGGLEDLEVRETDDRYYFQNLPMGIAEDRALDFHSPYGCSKGAADQYVLDYGRSYGLSTLVLRQSCIYGTRQFGIEDQGWVAWFIIAAVTGRSLTLYGTGKQVRDILYIDDLVDFFLLVSDNIDAYRGEVLNIGGGAERAVSLLQLLKLIESVLGREIPIEFGQARVGDQPVYISDIGKATSVTGWVPKVSVEEGVLKLVKWVEDNKSLFGT